MGGSDLFRKLDDSFIMRCTDKTVASQGWKDLTAGFAPVLDEDRPVPFLLTRDSGDLGLAMLWIVQSTVVRPILSAMIPCADDTIRARIEHISPISIGALAHSEPADNPVVYREAGTGWILSGIKKYITGGTEADFLLTTARLQGEEKISSLFYVPAEKLPDGSITPVLRDSLKTAPHGSLKLNSFPIEKEYRFDASAGDIRRLVLSLGLLERILIMEAFTGLVIYLRRTLGHTDDAIDERLSAMAGSIHEKFLIARKAFHSGERIAPAIPDMELLKEALTPLKEAMAKPCDDATAERLRDFKFLLSMIPGMK